MNQIPIHLAIVDDDKSVGKAVSGLLQASGFEVDAFDSARGFLEALPELQVDCVIIDVFMPGMNGLELQAHLRAGPSTAATILFSTHDDPELREQALNGGAMAFLRKPMRRKDLLDAIGAAVSNRSGKQ